jgi:glucose-6-phosphate 1-dehydrogenase
LYPYDPGTWGPEEAHQLIAHDGPWVDPKIVEDDPCAEI